MRRFTLLPSQCSCDDSKAQQWSFPPPGAISGDLEIRSFEDESACWELRKEGCAWGGMCIGLGECVGTQWNVTIDINDDMLLQFAIIAGSSSVLPDAREYCLDQSRETLRIEAYVRGGGELAPTIGSSVGASRGWGWRIAVQRCAALRPGAIFLSSRRAHRAPSSPALLQRGE